MRLFFAIELPAEVQAALASARDALALDPRRFRFAREDTLHLTLRFLGEVEDDRLPAVAAAGERAASRTSSIPCETAGFGSFPRDARARVVWVGISDRSRSQDLAALASLLEEEIRAAGFPPEGRPFAPHVTVARARDRRGSAVRGSGADPKPARFVAESLVLVRSRLGPSGARHEVIASFPFLAAPS